jgi:hypothetical protein
MLVGQKWVGWLRISETQEFYLKADLVQPLVGVVGERLNDFLNCASAHCDMQGQKSLYFRVAGRPDWPHLGAIFEEHPEPRLVWAKAPSSQSP